MAIPLLPTFLLGAVLGMRHATDADHVVAVTTIATRQKRLRDALRIGGLWGIGHTVTILLVGGGVILLHIAIPARLGLSMEFVVALMLIGLGAYNLFGGERWGSGMLASARPVAVGVVHGLAGSAAIALLVLVTIPDPRWALGYLLLFGAGTIIGMMGVTAVVAAPVMLGVERSSRLHRPVRLVSGVVSIAFGLFLATHLTVVDGLFSTVPLWVPR